METSVGGSLDLLESFMGANAIWLGCKVIKEDMSHMRHPTFSICENKGADQLRGHREADQGHCFRCADRTIPLLLIAKISSL